MKVPLNSQGSVIRIAEMSIFGLRLTALALVCALLGGIGPSLSAEKIHFNGTDHRAGYYVVPDNLPDDGGKVWVVVDVHGAGGLRNDNPGPGLARLLEPEPVIVLVPSFTNGYQAGDGQWADQLVENFSTIRGNHAVHDRMFIHGHSGGAQFAHRFAFTRPELVAGVSAHSAGSWACSGGYGRINPRARNIPFALSCGENDQALSVPDAPHNRIEWYRLFAAEMERQGFVFRGETWPGVGHNVPARLYGEALKECFLLATRGEKPASDLWTGDVDALAASIRSDLGLLPGPVAAVRPLSSRAESVLLAANEAVTDGRVPDTTATLRFLTEHPAPGWAADERFSALKEHCRSVALAYLDERQQAGQPLTGQALERFRRVTEGLGIEEPASPGETP